MALLGLGSMAAPAVTAQTETPSQPQPTAPSTAPLTAATVRVNGRSIPVCSHGQLCQGAFLRAISNRP